MMPSTQGAATTTLSMGCGADGERYGGPAIEEATDCNAPNVQSSDTIMIRNLHVPDNCAFKLGVWIIGKWNGGRLFGEGSKRSCDDVHCLEPWKRGVCVCVCVCVCVGQ